MGLQEMTGSWRSEVTRQFLVQDELQAGKAHSDILFITDNSTELKKLKVEEEGSFLCIPANAREDVDITCFPWQSGPGYTIHEADYVSLEKPSISCFMKVQAYSNVSAQKVFYGDSMDMEKEWQWLMSQQQVEPKCCVMPFIKCENDDKDAVFEDFEEIVHDDFEDSAESEQNVVVRKDYEDCSESFVSENVSSYGVLRSGTKTGDLTMKINKEKHSSCEAAGSRQSFKNLVMGLKMKKSEHKHGASWCTSNRKELAALSQRISNCESCDLRSPKRSSTCKASLMSFDLDPNMTAEGFSDSLDKTVLASLFHGNEPIIGNKSVLASPLICEKPGSRPLRNYSPRFSRPLDITSSLPSLKTESMNDGGANISYGARGSDALGEALCHSQTRAREAEKAAAQAVREKQQLEHLLLREACLSLTYRQWIHILELENMWLKLHIRDHPIEWMEPTCTSPSVALRQLPNKHWKHFGERFTSKQMQSVLRRRSQCRKCVSKKSNMVVGYTIGLAFVLGLSLAGAGFMIGWKLGWMLLAS